jgi:GTP-binding protein Era
MVQQAERSATEADVALLLVDGTRPFDRFDLVADLVGRLHVPLITAINKIDKVPLERVNGIVEEVRSRLGLDEVLTMSALRGQHVDETLEQLEQRLPLGPKLYPDDMIAEQPERFFVAEFIRQAAFDQLADELPYSIEVVIDEFRDAAGHAPETDGADRGSKTYIHATLFVERESQKGIVIGRKASRLRSIGSAARREVETLLDRPVFLDLRVKVRPDWRDKDRDLKEFGYGQ